MPQKKNTPNGGRLTRGAVSRRGGSSVPAHLVHPRAAVGGVPPGNEAERFVDADVHLKSGLGHVRID